MELTYLVDDTEFWKAVLEGLSSNETDQANAAILVTSYAKLNGT